MASTYSPTLRIELIGNGEQSGTWGTTTNTNLGSLLEQAITGVQTITMGDATYTLTAFDGAVDEARNAVLVLGGTVTSPQNLIAPSVEKVYIVANGTGSNITIKTSGGSGVTVVNGSKSLVYCDGTNFYDTTPNINSITGNLTVSGSGAFGNALAVTNGATIGSNLIVSGSVTAGSYVGVNGRVLQVVQSVYNSSTNTNSSSFISTGHTVSITPSSVSSKILILNTFQISQTDEFQPSNNALTTIYKNNSTNLAGGSGWFCQASSGYANSIYCNGAVSYLDSPATTGATTYTAYIRGAGSQPNAIYSGPALMIAMEIL
jgi:hypothetical protein